MATSNWEEVDYTDNQKALRKRFEFNNFAESLEFVNKVGAVAEDMNHHPDISLGWGFAEITTTTHDQKKVTDKDHELARVIDAIDN